MASNPQGFTGRLAERSSRRPWLVVSVWIGLLVVALAIAGGYPATFTNDMTFTNDPESVRADTMLADRMPDEQQAPDENVIVASSTFSVEDPEFQAFVGELQAELMGASDTVAMAASFYQLGDDLLVSDDRQSTILPVFLHDAEADAHEFLTIIEEADGREGFTVVTGGFASINATFVETSETDLLTGETIGISIALLVLVVVFGTLIAAGIPLLLAVFAILVSVGVTMLIGHAFDLSIFVLNMMIMIGLAVGIDYTLFILGRYREERTRGREKVAAIVRAADTASKAVFFSGLTVVIALLGMLIVPSSIFKSLGTGAIIVVIISVMATLTLLPAVISLLGDRVEKGRGRVLMGVLAGFVLLFSFVFRALEVSSFFVWGYMALAAVFAVLAVLGVDPFHRRKPDTDAGGFWARVASVVMRRPVVSVVLVGAMLIGLSSVYFTIEMGQSGISTLPENSSPYRALTILDEHFSAISIESPNVVVINADNVEGDQVQAGIDALMVQLAADPDFGPLTLQVNESGDLAAVRIVALGDVNSNESIESIERVRGEYIPQAFAGVDAEVLVTGPTAFTIDFNSLVSTYTPIVFAFVLGMSFILLLLAFRSVVVPLKSVLMNLLSVGAAYGLLVAVFQHGVGNEIFGFRQVERIDAWVPLMMFNILFGLSMDYHVFLLSRIRERYDITKDNAGSVAYGVRSTASMITGAALIMVAVFSGFAMGELVMFQQMGFGLAVAVILDATIIRSVLVPASMKLLGDWNWYLPSWLDWLPHVSVEGTPDHEDDFDHVPSRSPEPQPAD